MLYLHLHRFRFACMHNKLLRVYHLAHIYIFAGMRKAFRFRKKLLHRLHFHQIDMVMQPIPPPLEPLRSQTGPDINLLKHAASRCKRNRLNQHNRYCHSMVDLSKQLCFLTHNHFVHHIALRFLVPNYLAMLQYNLQYNSQSV